MILEICIPTHNRPYQFECLLRSIVSSLSMLSLDEKAEVGIRVHNNSSKYLKNYQDIFTKFETIFKNGKVGFVYNISGINISGPHNCYGVIMSSKADYAWFLPDDDLCRIDAIQIILETIKLYRPCMIHGGVVRKERVKYDFKQSSNYQKKDNKVFKVINSYGEKVKNLLKLKLIQAQEQVYSTKELKKINSINDVTGLVNDFVPALFSFLCINSNSPLILLQQSIGIFRDGDPNSPWRHQWFSMALCMWPKTAIEYFERGITDSKLVYQSRHLFFDEKMKKIICGRFDIIFGFNKINKINFVEFALQQRFEFFKILVMSFFCLPKKILKKCRNFFISK